MCFITASTTLSEAETPLLRLVVHLLGNKSYNKLYNILICCGFVVMPVVPHVVEWICDKSNYKWRSGLTADSQCLCPVWVIVTVCDVYASAFPSAMQPRLCHRPDRTMHTRQIRIYGWRSVVVPDIDVHSDVITNQPTSGLQQIELRTPRKCRPTAAKPDIEQAWNQTRWHIYRHLTIFLHK